MCGIAGIISPYKNEVSIARLKIMTDAIAHRGPDGEGHWISEEGTTGLGNRRLAIIDLSPAGRQPMQYLDRYTITYNGEIYNYRELRDDCLKKGYRFNSETDTEVLMALYDWKGEDFLQELDGMFAFALYDAREKKMFIARDRFGEKPFFYHHHNNIFLFGSEMKALWAAGVPREMNKRMLYNFMAFNYTGNPGDPSETFFTNIRSLPPAHFLRIDTTTLSITIEKYFDIDPGSVNNAITQKEAEQKFRELLYQSVSRRLRSDVSTGSSLSGGIDSSIIVSVIADLNKENQTRQATFSAVFPGYVKDERSFIDTLLKDLRVDAHFTSPAGETLIDDLQDCFYFQEEPFGSASVLTQFQVMKLAKQKRCTVLLDGQGADELLAGYHSYFSVFFNECRQRDRRLYRQEKKTYKEKFSGSLINPIPDKNIRYYAGQLGWIEKDRLKKLYERFMQGVNPYFNHDFYFEYRNEQFGSPAAPRDLNQALYNSVHHGLPELLRFADRNSMGQGREVRLPFLSHELVTFLFSLPSTMKIHEGWTKYIARTSFEHLLPPAIAWRKDKIGYEPPQKEWLRSDAIRERVMALREKLIQDKILHKSILTDPVTADDANIGTKTTWNQLMLSFLFG